jgi:hypothetical protein
MISKQHGIMLICYNDIMHDDVNISRLHFLYHNIIMLKQLDGTLQSLQSYNIVTLQCYTLMTLQCYIMTLQC